MKPAARRAVAAWACGEYEVSVRRACCLSSLAESTYRYRSRRKEPEGLRSRLLELAAERPRFGYRRLHVLLVREGWRVNHKRIQRMYREERLMVRRKRRKRVAMAPRERREAPVRANERWSMDFTSDSLESGRGFRTLNVVDDFTRECVAIEVDTSISGERVGRVLDRVIERRGLPTTLIVDNGPEFTSRALDAWAYRRGIQLDFIRPGKPVENCFVESFNGKFRDECLSANWFVHLEDARRRIEIWRHDYNRVRPHQSLGDIPPKEYATQQELQPPPAACAPAADIIVQPPGLS